MSVVLVVGPEGVSTKAFVERLVGHDCEETCSWLISTKYYDAEVAVNTKVLCDETKESIADIESEALILVADWTHQSSFAQLRSWFESQRNGKSTSPISLLIADKIHKSTEHPSWLEEATEWSIENGFEMIHVCTEDASSDEELKADGHGMDRVKEALEAHMWPGCSLKNSKTGKSVEASPAQTSQQSQGESSSPNEDETGDEFEKLLLEMTSVFPNPLSFLMERLFRCTGSAAEAP